MKESPKRRELHITKVKLETHRDLKMYAAAHRITMAEALERLVSIALKTGKAGYPREGNA